MGWILHIGSIQILTMTCPSSLLHCDSYFLFCFVLFCFVLFLESALCIYLLEYTIFPKVTSKNDNSNCIGLIELVQEVYPD